MSHGPRWAVLILISLVGCVARPMQFGAQTYATPQYVTAPGAAAGPVASPGLAPTPISYPQSASAVIVTPTVTASSYYAPGQASWQTQMVNAPGTYVTPGPRYVDMTGTIDGRPPRWHWMGRRYGSW